MKELNNRKVKKYILWVLVVLAVVLVVLVIFLITQFRSLYRHQILNAWESRISQTLQRYAPFPTNDAGVIRYWMTFDYINKLFELPPNYLKMKLSITDSRYPRLTIYSYAKSENLNQTVFLGEIVNSVREYLPTKTSTSTNNT